MIRFLLLLLALTDIAVAADNTLINGQPVPAGEYEEVVYISMSGSRCTATLVGERVIITAAHCVNNGQTATFQVKQNQYSSRCTRSSLYPGQDHDVALCKTDRVVAGVKPASVDAERLQIGERVTLLGYGCTRPGGGGGNDGTLRYGTAEVVGFSNYDVVTQKGAALCFGDSGGPMMRDKKIVGINSKGNIQDTSYNLQLALTQSISFMRGYAESNSVEICGVTSECHPPLPKNPCITENLIANYFDSELGKAKSVLKMCEES